MNTRRGPILLSLHLVLVASCTPAQAETSLPVQRPCATPTTRPTGTPTATSTISPSPTPAPTFTPVVTPTPVTLNLIDDFEGRSAPYPWTVSIDRGASGSLTLGEGHAGTGALLQYDLTSYPQVASANLVLSPPISAATIGFWIKSPPGAWLLFNALDSTGQTLQYWPARPLEARDPDSWYYLAIQLNAPDGWWGGANDGSVHGRIVEIKIAVTNLLDPEMEGAIAIDDVTAFPDAPVYLDPATLPLVPAPQRSGDLAGILGVGMHSDDFTDALLDQAQSIGFSYISTDLWWHMVESSPGEYDFSYFDDLARRVEARGMRLLLGFDTQNHLYTRCDTCRPDTPEAIDGYGLFAEAAASHYAGRVRAFLVGGEPELYWDPQTYHQLLAETIRHIRLGDPSATVIAEEPEDGATTLWPFDELRAFLAAGLPSGYDAIGHECYLFGFPPEHVSDMELFYDSIVRAFIPNAPPLWCPEVGLSTSDYGVRDSPEALARHGVLVSRLMLTRWTMGYPAITYYEMIDETSAPNDWEGAFGLLASDLTEKPAMMALRTLLAIASERTYVGLIPLIPTSLHALRMDGPEGTVLAVWLDAPGQQLTIEVPPSASARDFVGVPLALEPRGPYLALTLREADGPVYLTFPTR